MTDRPQEPARPPEHVVVTDVRMPFGSMVVFMVKWAIAAIPAILIIGIIATFAVTAASAFFRTTSPEPTQSNYEREMDRFLDSLRRTQP